MVKKDTVLILDFGSQYTQLIARRVRECKVFSRIVPFDIPAEDIVKLGAKGLILSGGPASVYERKSPIPDKGIFKLGIPVLGVCYGMQVICHLFGGKVKNSAKQEYGKTELFIDDTSSIFSQLPANLTSWMSHADAINKVPSGFKVLAHTLTNPHAAIGNHQRKIFGVQFHPEVVHTQHGKHIIQNFLFKACRCSPRWVMNSFVKDTIEQVRATVGNKNVICGLSGGVDSSVTAVLLHRAIGKRLVCIFIDNGLLRKNEVKFIRKTFTENFHLNLRFVNASSRFLKALKGVTDPEEKRKIIGAEFIHVFEESAKKVKGALFLAQGTLYPDVIESKQFADSPSAKIKSHHNVGGLPAHMKLKLIEPMRDLFKDEVREIGKYLNVPEMIIHRQPFPGPGLAVRVIGEVTEERLELLRNADEVVLDRIQKSEHYPQIWQSFAVLLPIKSVGVMGDRRSYEHVAAIRCVSSTDGMTADWVRLNYDLLDELSHAIINEVKGINRVVYDISSKPPATIEWE